MLTENVVRWTREWMERNRRDGMHSPTVTRNLEVIVAAAEGHGESGEARMRDLLYQIAHWDAAGYPQDAAFWQRRIAELFVELGVPTGVGVRPSRTPTETTEGER